MAKISEDTNFTTGSTEWPYVYRTTGLDQKTLTINVTSLPENSTVRVIKILDIGPTIVSGTTVLSLGSNVIEVATGKLDRTVYFHFSNGDIEFDSLTLT